MGGYPYDAFESDWLGRDGKSGGETYTDANAGSVVVIFILRTFVSRVS